MKLLYIGHYKENSGWSKSAINNIEALHDYGIDIVCRNVKLTESKYDIPILIQELENKDLTNIDYCIQHVLPHHVTGTDKFKKNVGYFMHEVDSIKHHQWYQNLNLLDQIWVANNDQKNNLIKDGMGEKKIKVIPQALNIKSYKSRVGAINFEDKNHTFKFYFICEIDDRKNLESIIRCFHSEFHSSEPVSLILKIKRTGIDPKALRNGITNICNEIKSNMRLYESIDDYHKETIITEDFTDEQIKILHYSCDCYVGPTHGEAWGIPAFDAMCYGNTPICSNEGGPRDYIDPNNKNTGWLVDGQMGICSHRNSAFKDLFTGRHHWFIPNEIDIKRAMRYYYENRDTINKADGLVQAEKFSYEQFAKKVKEALDD